MSRSQILRTLTHGLCLGILGFGALPLQAADRLLVRFSGLEIPLDLQQLEAWARQPERNAELGPWLNLLDADTRRDLQQLLLQPLNLQSSSIPLMMQSWAGRQLVLKLGTLLRSPEGDAGPLLLELLQQQGQPTVVSLLRQARAPRLELDLDALTQLGEQLRTKLQRQKALLQQVRSLSLPPLLPPPERDAAFEQQQLVLAVPHRPQPLELSLWWPRQATAPQRWILLSHGLGGSTEQMRWLAEALVAQGWPVLAVEHPSSDDDAVRALIEGRQALPGLETLPLRLQDLQQVEAAVRSRRIRFGLLPPPPRLVLVGHSLGALTSLVWAGAEPQPGLQQRCDQGLRSIPVLDSSYLLQCQLPELQLPELAPPPGLEALVLMNSFGSLLWHNSGLDAIQVPVLSIGGSLDLITPPHGEQWQPFMQLRDPRSRLVLVEGGSHFSAVGVSRDEALMQLGSDLVGKDPAQVQRLLQQLLIGYLNSLSVDQPPPVGVLRHGAVRGFVLEQQQVQPLKI